MEHQTDDTVATATLKHNEESLLHSKMEVDNESGVKPTELCLQTATHLVSSITSSLADTPGDSGVLCLDSEGSEATGQALMTHSLVGTEELTCDSHCDLLPSTSQDIVKSTSSSLMAKSDFYNKNVDRCESKLLVERGKSPLYENLPDVVLKALESEKVSTPESEKHPKIGEPKKSLSEDIVYRRRCRKKSQNSASSQKKRVSFHEDILNNTKTDNIHIERGYVTYQPDNSYCQRFRQRNNIQTDRFSWCASGDKASKYSTELGQQTMSEILTYGSSNTDKSGVFEYTQDDEMMDTENDKDNNNTNNPKSFNKMYSCDSNSSDSNISESSSSSDSSSSNSNDNQAANKQKKDKTQKSHSCDEFDNNNHLPIMRKTYFSEADIDRTQDRDNRPLDVSSSPITVKSVLKKNRYITTNVVEERKKRKMLNLLDTNNIIGSLKLFYKNFNFNLSPEKGLSETSFEVTNVVEALASDVNHNKNLCKSLDSGLQIDDDDDDFVEINLNDSNGDVTKNSEMTSSQTSSLSLGANTPKEGSPRHKLTLNMKKQHEKKTDNMLPPVSKYVVNCESTVYEHKGITYSYVHDTFQTAFEAPKQCFVPIPETVTLRTPSVVDSDVDSASRASTPKILLNRDVQDEIDLKNRVSKHLASPKKQINKYSKKSASTLKLNDEVMHINSEECSNTDNSTIRGADDIPDEFINSPANIKLQAHKSAMLNRYLKSVCQKQDHEMRIHRNKFFQTKLLLQKRLPSIIYPYKLVSKTFHDSARKMSRLIDKEVIENKRLSVRLLTADEPSYFDSFEDNVAMECSENLKLQIFSYPNETLNRMMKVRSPYDLKEGSWSPLLVFITDYALYVAFVKCDDTKYEVLCRLPHDELDAIAVGPEAQYVQVIDSAGNIACSLVTGESSLGSRFASSLEWSARTSPLRIQRPPALLPLSCKQVASAIARKRHEKEIPQVLFYGRVCSGDATERFVEAPGAFAPPLEGYLMYRTEKHKRFEPCYFLLRAGVLHWGPYPQEGAALPNSLSLRTVMGVKRHSDTSLRPHCFEIASNSGPRLVMAAPDEPTASSWLQSLLLHAAQALEDKDAVSTVDPRAGELPSACTVIVTPTEVISVRETLDPAFIVGAAPYLRDRGFEPLLKDYMSEMRTDVEVLACGSIRNLTAFKIPDTDDNWCCLEWSVCEARERGAGLALVFSSSTELERFIATVEKAYCAISTEPFPLSVVASSKSGCAVAHSKFVGAWSHMLPAQQ